jgi:uncharacterized lipoprotein YmbA
MRRQYCSLLGALIARAAGCRSAPLHYHTLVPAPEVSAAPQRMSSYSVEITAVKIPPQVDRPELVIRQRDGRVALLENELWIAPLADELRSAMSIELVRRLSSADAHGPGRGRGPMVVRVDIERFESAPGNYALVEALWSLRFNSSARPDEVVVCRTLAFERVPEGNLALVRAHQHVVALIADDIAATALRVNADDNAVCPVPCERQ